MEEKKELTSDQDVQTDTKAEISVAQSETDIEETITNTSDEITHAPVIVGDTVVAVEDVSAEASETPEAAKKSSPIKNYVIAGLIVIVMGGGLWAVLEQQGRVSSNIFGSFIPSKAAATVNGVKISRQDFERNRQQIIQSATAQGFDVSTPELTDVINEQAIQSLVNTELLRQAAKERNIVITTEQIDARYAEVAESVGGAETLVVRMAEIGLTESELRKDIESELMVTQLFAMAVDKSDIEVSEEQILEFYEVNGGAEALPPLEDVREQIITELRLSAEQEREAAFIESLRSEATIVINV